MHLRQVANPTVVVQDFETGEKRPAGRAFSSLPDVFPVGPFHMAFTPDSSRLVIGSGSSATISVWRIKDGRLLRQIERAHGDRAGASSVGLNYVAVTPDGHRIVSCGESVVPIAETKLKYGPRNVNMSEVRVWDLETGERIRNLGDDEDHGFGYGALSPDGKHLAVSDFSLLRIMDTETGKPEQTISLPGSWDLPRPSHPTALSSRCRSRTRSLCSKHGPAVGCTTTMVHPMVRSSQWPGRRPAIGS